MIAHLSGKLLRIAGAHVVVDVGGVGYKVAVPVSTLTSLPGEGEGVSFHIHTNVREDAIELYGFGDELEEQVFEILISVSGVGPKMALGVLSAMTVRDIAAAARDEGLRLQGIPGIGKKTAQRIALEVGDKLQELALVAAATSEPGRPDVLSDVVEGLVGLGYSRGDSRRAAQEARKRLPSEENAAVIIREALGLLNS